jgi:hypothetical protein
VICKIVLNLQQNFEEKFDLIATSLKNAKAGLSPLAILRFSPLYYF